MKNWKDERIREIAAQAERAVARLAGEFVRAEPGEREAIWAALQEEKWLAGACRELVDPW